MAGLLQMDPASVERVNHLLTVAFRPQAVKALNRAALAGQTAMVRAVAQQLGVKQAAVKPYIGTVKAEPNLLQARVFPGSKGKWGIPLGKLDPSGPDPSRGKGPGVRVRATPNRFPHAFLATMPKSGHRGVFERKGAARLPIRQLFTRPIPQVFREVRSVGVARAAEALKTNLVSELRYALLKRGA